jgi:nucleoside-diphosphate kinase
VQTTFIMIKPDGVQRNLIAPILDRFLSKVSPAGTHSAPPCLPARPPRRLTPPPRATPLQGYILRGLRFMNVSKELAEAHYADLSSKGFFSSLIDYITSGPVVAIALEGKSVVEQARKIIGATNPLAADPGSIRGMYCIDIGRNIIHGSDSVENAQKELAMWFDAGLVDNSPVLHGQIYE